MIKLSMAFLIIGLSHAFGQNSTSDPERLFIISDSLNGIDTTKLELKREFLQLRYNTELSLYHFDKQEKHLLLCIQCCDQMAHENKFSTQPLLQGMWCGDFLVNEDVMVRFYRLLVENKLEEKLTDNEKYQVDRYVRKYNLNSIEGAPKFFGKTKDFDTTVTILSDKRLIKNDLQNKKFEFVEGDSTYLEITIAEAKRRNPKCIRNLVVLISDPQIPDVMFLNDNNCVYSSPSTAFSSKPIALSGKLVRNESGLYILIKETELPNRNISSINTMWISPGKLGN